MGGSFGKLGVVPGSKNGELNLKLRSVCAGEGEWRMPTECGKRKMSQQVEVKVASGIAFVV